MAGLGDADALRVIGARPAPRQDLRRAPGVGERARDQLLEGLARHPARARAGHEEAPGARQARAAQEALLKNFPDSAKAPDAMLAIASVQYEAGDNGSARNTLEDIIARYPSSDAAAKARIRLTPPRR